MGELKKDYIKQVGVGDGAHTTFLFQSDKEGDDNSNVEPRSFDYPGRPVLNERERAVVKVIIDAMDSKKDCSPPSNCVLPEEVQPHIPHIIESVKEVGGGSFPKGINSTRDLIKGLISIISIGKRVLVAALISMFLAFLGLIYMIFKLGLITKLQGGM